METITLGNGLTSIFDRRAGTGVVALQVWVKVGSKDEERQVAGITHFIEHLLFKGTATVKANDMAARIEGMGGAINAFTSYDNTVYHIVVPSAGFEEGAMLLFDAVLNPLFPDGEIAKEKRVVLEEITMGEDDPQRRLFKELYTQSYVGEPYGRPIIGFEETVRGITRDNIVRYYRTHYRPDTMVIVIVGDFQRDRAEALVRGLTFEAGASPAPWVSDEQPKGGGLQATTLLKDVRESYLAFSYPAPPLTHDDVPALDVLVTLLGDGESSRLQRELKQKKGLVSNIAAFLFAPKERGLVIVYATFGGKETAEILKAFDEEVGRLKYEGPSDWELTKAKNMIRAGYVYATETVQGKARQIGHHRTLTGDHHFVERYLDRIAGVTKEDILRVLNRYVAGPERRVVSILPQSTPNPHTYRFDNGFTCAINVDRSSSSLAFRIGFIGGLGEEPPGRNGLFNVLARMLLKGTTTRDANGIAREIDLLAGDISPFNGRNIFGLSGRFLGKDWREALTLLADLATTSVMRDDELKRVKDDVHSSIRQRDDDPVAYTFRRFNETLYEGHPYSRDPLGTLDDVSALSLDELSLYQTRFLSPANGYLAISGDVDEEKVVTLLRTLFSAWSGPRRDLTHVAPSVPARRSLVFAKQIRQSHMIFGFAGPGLLDPNRHAAEVLDAILSGMSGRIHKVLREENPMAYATTFFNQMAFDAGAMGIYAGTTPSQGPMVSDIVRRELERIIAEGFTEEEVERAKRYLIGNHMISMQANPARATSMCLDMIYGLKPNYFKVWPLHIEKVSKGDVERVAREYLRADRMVTLVVGPEKDN